MTAALYQQQSGSLPRRGCPLKAVWFQPSISQYSPDMRGPTITKPNPRTGPTTPHFSRSNPRPCCTDPAAIRFATSNLPLRTLETAQLPTPDLVYQLSLVVQDHHVKVPTWSGYAHGSSSVPTGTMQQLAHPLSIWSQGPSILLHT